MNVKELIEILKEIDGDYKVVLQDDDGDFDFFPCINISTEEKEVYIY